MKPPEAGLGLQLSGTAAKARKSVAGPLLTAGAVCTEGFRCVVPTHPQAASFPPKPPVDSTGQESERLSIRHQSARSMAVMLCFDLCRWEAFPLLG